MLWLADEFLAQVPDGDPVNDVVTALKAYHRGSVADAPRTLADLAGAITLAKVMLEVFEPPRLTEFLEALDTLEEQITAELAQARHAQTVREAYTPAAGSVIQAATDSAGPSEQAKNTFGRWASSVSNGRSGVGPMRGWIQTTSPSLRASDSSAKKLDPGCMPVGSRTGVREILDPGWLQKTGGVR